MANLTKSPWIFTTTTSSGPKPEACLGGKAANLLRLTEAGCPVPPLFAISAEAFRARAGNGRH